MPRKSKRQVGQRDRRAREAKSPAAAKAVVIERDHTDEAIAASAARFRDERRENVAREQRNHQMLTRREPDLDASRRVRRPSLLLALPPDVFTVARCARTPSTYAREHQIS